MRASQDVELPGAPRAFVLGGNTNTLAFVTSLRADGKTVTAHLLPIAQTPIGAVCGDSWQDVALPLESLLDWIDATFAADDERAFVAQVREVELLARVNWHVEPPQRLDEAGVLNAEDLPQEIADALAHPPERLVQCASCRRLCVHDHFVWKDRQLCAWDYHRQVFGKRGPWQNGAYEDRHFNVIPVAAYVAPPLLEETGCDVILAVAAIEDAVALQVINLVAVSESSAHMAVRTPDGYTLLRER